MKPPRVERPDMADYGVPADAAGALPWAWAAERLRSSQNFWVVTADGRGQPSSMPVWAAWSDEAGVLWFSCSPNARKARNLAANPRCAICADSTIEVVSLEGTAHLLGDGPRRAAAISAYVAKYAPVLAEQFSDGQPRDHAAELAAFVAGHAVFEMVPQRGFGIIERADEFAARATRWVFD